MLPPAHPDNARANFIETLLSQQEKKKDAFG